MFQEFNEEKNVHVNRDDKGVVRDLIHGDTPVVTDAPTAQLAAQQYLNEYGDLLGIQNEETNNLTSEHDSVATAAPDELRFHSEKQQFDTTTVAYHQTRYGLPVWHGGVSIQMKNGPYRVVSAQSTRHADLDMKPPTQALQNRLMKLSKSTLATQLGLTDKVKDFDRKSLAIEKIRLDIYRYAAAKRVISPPEPSESLVAPAATPTLPLPPVADSVEEGQHYVCAEVYFTLAPRGLPLIHWLAIVEGETLSVLYLRAFISDVNAMVFQFDPMTTNNGPLPNATGAALNAVRTSVVLPGLVPPSGGIQSLRGVNVQVVDVETPVSAPPTEPAGTDFNFNSRTDNFAAVNAYYHCDRFFRLVADMGFSLGAYFGTATAFPNAVDHRGLGGNVINAHCLGTSGGLGILQTTFALADTTDVTNPIGIACDFRVVLHELGGHGVLYPHVHSPNFGFAHSAGDSVAAITNDPDTHAADRFVTFPWVNIGRRHDRTPASGFGWSGNIALHPFTGVDGGGYNNEQILSTTLFRVYRSIGGDSASLPTRQFAARFAVYLILRAIHTLTPMTNPSNAAGFATALMNADLGDWTSEGHSGGAYGKVIRWSFEKQGLYQPAGTPTPNNNPGAPPPVDVYIDDGRQGEYQYQPNHWSCQAIWNRRHNDGLTTHEEPVVGVTNFAYVKIKNRGTQTATGVVVKAFHANPAAGLVYPNDWQPMTTAQLPAPNVAPNSSAEIVVGPFSWVPTQIGHECMFMVVSATGDPSNISNMTAGDSIGEWRLVPNDNNIGQRNVFPVAGAGGGSGLITHFASRKIMIKNPLRSDARMIVKATLPSILAKAGWDVTFENAGGGAFALKAGEAKSIAVSLKQGKDFTVKDVKASRDKTIHIEAYANGILVGGMSYQLDPTLKGPPK
jgi:zinc metalloprotease ZmpB